MFRVTKCRGESRVNFLPKFSHRKDPAPSVFGSPHRMIAEWVGGSANIWVQAYKNASHVQGSTANSATAEGGHECPLPSGVLTQALRQKHCASAISMHIDRVALQLRYWLDWRNGAVGLERSKQIFLVTIGKVVAQSKSVSHMGRKNGPKTRFSARPWQKGWASDAVHPEVQNTNWEDWGIACRH